MASSICVLTPTCTLGYGFNAEAFARGMSMKPDVIAVDAGSTDPGPHYLGSGDALVGRFSIKQELEHLLVAAHQGGIPVIVGSAGGSGSAKHVNVVAQIVREVAQEQALVLQLARIYSDIPATAVSQAVESGQVFDFEAGYELDVKTASDSSTIVAQMGYEPIIAALDKGADVIIAGRACDDAVIASYPIWKGADPGLAIHMGKILECGAFSAEPHGTDVMMGTIDSTGFTLEPGSLDRRASLSSVAAHTLYERENPFYQIGPGHAVDLNECTFRQISNREVRVEGSRFTALADYRVKLEGVRCAGFRSICIAGVRCPTTIECIDSLLDDAKSKAETYFNSPDLRVTFHVYGRNGVMGQLETEKTVSSHELGVVIDVVERNQEAAHAVAHFLSGSLLHAAYPGQFNTAGNLAFLYSPSEIDAGPVYEFSIYHLMTVESANQYFPVKFEQVS